MARMIPSAVPPGARSNAEKRAFDALQRGLDDSYVVLFDVEWLGRGEYAGSQGQCDFLVLHPSHGALTIEVKGGVLRRGDDGTWTSDGADATHIINDPFSQSNRSKHALQDYIRATGNIAAANAAWGHAVWFTDARAPADCGPSAHPSIVLDFDAAADPRAAIERAFAYWNSRTQPRMGPEGVERIVNAIGKPLQLHVPLAVTIQQEAEVARALTAQQYNVLGMISRMPRAVISGPAGSGKTMLAIEQCRRFSESGFATLYVCFNRRLADWAQRTMRGWPNARADTFHGLVDALAAEDGIALPSRGDRTNEFFDDVAPDVLMSIADCARRFDAIVIDEAQDFHELWLMSLTALLREHGREVIFLDGNQEIFPRTALASLMKEAMPLTVNCRTTKAIHRTLLPYHTGDAADCDGPEGRAPERIAVRSDINEAREVQRVLHRLTHDEGIAPRSIVILTPRHATSHWVEGLKLGNFSLTWNDARDESKQVLCATIQAYKGMESDIVLVTEMSKVQPEQEKQMWYTACSRARHHLVIFEMQPEAAG